MKTRHQTYKINQIFILFSRHESPRREWKRQDGGGLARIGKKNQLRKYFCEEKKIFLAKFDEILVKFLVPRGLGVEGLGV